MTLGKSLEDYLETILILKIKKGMVRSIDVADYMGFSKPRVSHAVKQLKTQGFLLMDNNGQRKDQIRLDDQICLWGL